MSDGRRPAVSIVGAGRLARTLAPLLVCVGYPLKWIASPGARSARRLRGALGCGRATADPLRAAREATLVLLAVPDRAIAPLARSLSAGMREALRGRIVMHHAGALGLETLSPLARRGASVAILHPLQCLGDPRRAQRALAGSRARVDGDRRGLAAARRMARDLGLVPLRLGGGARERELYHAAASMASNDLLALLDLAAEALERTGLDRAAAIDALVPLMGGTLDAVAGIGPERALTGPVVRGDAATLAAHLRRLGNRSAAGEAHRLLSGRLLRLAARAGRLPRSKRLALARLLRNGG